MIKNTELELEKQKLHINEEYYIELEKQYDSSNILIHDIKKCLGNIKGLLLQNDNSKAIEYIDSIYDGYKQNHKVIFDYLFKSSYMPV